MVIMSIERYSDHEPLLPWDHDSRFLSSPHPLKLSAHGDCLGCPKIPQDFEVTKERNPSGMVKRFLAARSDPRYTHVTYKPEPWEPVHYFYDSLMDEKQLILVLRLK